MSSIDSFSQLFVYINRNLRKCEQILSIIGLYFVCKISAKLLYKLLNTSYVHIWSQIRPIVLNDEPNSWAVITFSANSTGISFAEQLAQKGLNLILIDQNEETLQLISNQISSEYSVEVMTIIANLSQGLEVFESIERQIRDKKITVLVNNVSQINPLVDNYSQLSSQQIYRVLNSEIASVLIITSIILPQMQSRRHGFIINISSLLGLKPTPYLSLESATKAFVDHFSTALSYECRPNRIRIESLMPSFRSHRSVTGLIAPTHQTYAKCALNTIGFTHRSTGYLWHEFQYFLLSPIPQQFWSLIAFYSFNSLKSHYI